MKPDAEITKLYRIEMVTEHDECIHICPDCNGSGEGIADGTICLECKGMGEQNGLHEGERFWTIEWVGPDEWEIVDGEDLICPGCGYDFMEAIKEDLEWLHQNGKITQ